MISTLGSRGAELERLFESLSGQDYSNFEVLVVDQNPDDRLAGLFQKNWPFLLERIHRPGERGLSKGRNAGWRAARGQLVLFPDDDCWYPPFLLSRALEMLNSLQADVITGRASDESGRDINGRYAKKRQRINRSNVWISGIEWVMVFKKSTLVELDGFDEQVGLGANTPWQSCEGQDIILRALAAGKTCFFDPNLFGYHEELNVMTPNSLMVSKGRAYGRGLGHVLRTHKYNALEALMWIARPILKLFLQAAKGNLKPCTYLLNVSIGRLEGYMGRTWE